MVRGEREDTGQERRRTLRRRARRKGQKRKQNRSGRPQRKAKSREGGDWKPGKHRPDPLHWPVPTPSQGGLGPPQISLTTLSSGTERLRVHSWLFTKESAGEKAPPSGPGRHAHLDHPPPAVSYTAPPWAKARTQHGPNGTPAFTRFSKEQWENPSRDDAAPMLLREDSERRGPSPPSWDLCPSSPFRSDKVSDSHPEPHLGLAQPEPQTPGERPRQWFSAQTQAGLGTWQLGRGASLP